MSNNSDKINNPKITVLPYSSKYEKQVYRKVKYQVQNRPPINPEDKILNRLSEIPKNKSRNLFTPTDYNNIGRVWTF